MAHCATQSVSEGLENHVALCRSHVIFSTPQVQIKVMAHCATQSVLGANSAVLKSPKRVL